MLEAAWALTADAFARQQVLEYRRGARVPLRGWHPWVPGLSWYQEKRLLGRPLRDISDEALVVARDMFSLMRLPDVFPAHREAVVARIKRERDRALWEVRVAGQYLSSGIAVEWSAVTSNRQGSPDVWLPEFGAEIQVKCLDRAEDPASDPVPALRSVEAARSQLLGTGPGAIIVAVSGASSLAQWQDRDSLFRQYMSLMLDDHDFDVVSALVFVTDPVRRRGRRTHFYGNPAWRIVNQRATHPWPPGLPLVTDDPDPTV